MNEKLVAGIVTAAGIGPICAVCVLGPAAVGSALTGAFVWLGGAGPLLTVISMVAVALLVYRTARRKRIPTVEDGKPGFPGKSPGIRAAKHAERT